MINKIEEYDFGKININDKTYEHDLIIFPDKIKSDWWRIEGHSLCIDDLKDVIEYEPEILIIGTGYSGIMEVPSKLIKELQEKKIKVEVYRTKEATTIFNDYIKEHKKVIAALHLTC